MPRGQRAERIEYSARLRSDLIRWREQHHGIKIALQGDTIAYLASGPTQVDRPVHPDGITAGIGDFVQPEAAALGEHDGGHATPLGLALQPREDLAGIRQGERLEIAICEDTAP